jgi:SGNH domain (fused to AT3 domains)
VGAWRKLAGGVVAAVLVAGLFPTFRAMVNGASAQPTLVAAPVPRADNPLVAATRASQAAPSGALRVLLVGNSVADLLAPAFEALATSPPLAVLDESVDGCGFPPDLTRVNARLPGGRTFPQPLCDPFWEPEVIARFRPDIVFWIVSDPLGTGGTYRGHHVRPCTEPYDSLYRKRLRQEVAVLGARGARVVIPTEPYSRYLGTANYDWATDCQNSDRRAVAKQTGALLVDLFGYICPKGECRVKQDGVTLRPDGLHFAGPGGEIVARWLLDQVETVSQ